MTKKIIWRLSEKPSTESLQKLVSSGILTKDEARTILFNETDESERSVESYQQEIKFLRDIIEALSKKDKVVEIIKEYHDIYPYLTYRWYQPYYGWTTWGNATTNVCLDTSTNIGGTGTYTSTQNFSDISTF